MSTMVEMRGRLFTMRMSDGELARFEELASVRGTTVAGAIRMLLEEEEQRIANETRDSINRDLRKWESDKAYVKWLVGLANLRKLQVFFDEKKRRMGLTDARDTQLNLTIDNIVPALENWAGSDIIEVDVKTGAAKVREGSRVTTHTPPPETKWQRGRQ